MKTELYNTINDESIEKLVRTFYPTVLKDALVGPFFIEKLGDDIKSDVWEEHLVLISQFWAFVALGDETYAGRPMAPHFEMEGISRKAFEQWLKLFSEAIDEVYIPERGEYFKTRSADIAENFMRNLRL
ncbi:MAG: group III truncated hemoglobin [Campylobacterota bacterium]|nr:group III truncated hemoglobin [Campylobacterota bacterium]